MARSTKKTRRSRGKLLSFLFCTTTINQRRRSASPVPATDVSPPRSSLSDDGEEGSFDNETVNVKYLEARSSLSSSKNYGDLYQGLRMGGSLASRSQNTPSPVLSSSGDSPPSESFVSAPGRYYATPANQSPTKVSTTSADIDDWIRNGRKLPYLQNNQTTRRGDEARTWLSCPSVYESVIGGNDQAALPSIHKEEVSEHEDGSPFLLPYEKLLNSNRPKPYQEFLNEVDKQWGDSKATAWEKAQQIDLLEKVRKREAAIKEWKLRETRKAMKEVEELENKQKKKLSKAMEKLQKKMNKIHCKEAEKKAKEKRLSSVSEDANVIRGIAKLGL